MVILIISGNFTRSFRSYRFEVIRCDAPVSSIHSIMCLPLNFSLLSLSLNMAKRVSIWARVNPTLVVPSSLPEMVGRCSPYCPAKDANLMKLWSTARCPGAVEFWATALAPGRYPPPWFARLCPIYA